MIHSIIYLAVAEPLANCEEDRTGRTWSCPAGGLVSTEDNIVRGVSFSSFSRLLQPCRYDGLRVSLHADRELYRGMKGPRWRPARVSRAVLHGEGPASRVREEFRPSRVCMNASELGSLGQLFWGLTAICICSSLHTAVVGVLRCTSERPTMAEFPVAESLLDLTQPAYQSNQEAWKPVLQEFAENLKRTTSEGTAQSLDKHQSRGQLLARDRISLLLDSNSSFLELGVFAGFDLDDSSPCASLLAGIGCISGRICLVIAHIATQSGGAWNEMTVIKQNRVTEIANENDLPLVALVQSAGVFLPQQFRVFHKGGQIFRDLAVRTQNGQASCAIVFGSSTAGGAYHPGLSDYTIFVENQ
jgi:hypothetical protein